MKKLYYFAYGSNMLFDRIEERVGEVIKVGNYTLKDWELKFNCGHTTHSYANIVPKEGREVEGVLYHLDEWQVSVLDRCEGYPRNYEKRYFIVDDDAIGFAYVSVSKQFYSNRKPTLYYLNYLIDGALQNNLEKAFNALVDYKDANFDLSQGNKHRFKSEESKQEYIRQLNSYSEWKKKYSVETTKQKREQEFRFYY